MQTKERPSDRAGRRIVKLGEAKRLTRASFAGNTSEMVTDKLYKIGG